MVRLSSPSIERAVVFGLGIACLVVVALTAFSVSDSVDLSPAASQQSSSVHDEPDRQQTAATGTSTILYASYEPRVLRLRKPIVLFFAKASDLFSLQHDMQIQSLAAAHTLRLSVYLVDFDTGTGARLAFGVVVPDTFVLLDAQGQRTSLLIHPTPHELHALLSTPSP